MGEAYGRRRQGAAVRVKTMSFLRRLLNTLRRERLDRDIERELAFHVAERADALREQGLSAEESARQARLKFGNPMVQAERTREVDITRWLDAFLRNVRCAVRAIVRSPGFAATVVVTLAVGIGANSAVFSAIDAVLLKALPIPNGDRLVRVMELLETETDVETQIAPARLEDWASRATALESLTGYYVEDVSDTTGALPERVRRAVIARRFFEVWGVAPAVGRRFTAADYRVGGPPTVLISDRYWRTRLDADPGVLRRIVRIEGQPYAIAGVMPESFGFPDRRVDFWWPHPVDSTTLANTPQNRKLRWYTGIGRLNAGVTPAQAQADLATVQVGLAHEYPDTDALVGVRVVPYRQTLIGDVRGSLWLLYGSVSLLLLIACTNIAALLLSRTAQRAHEVALRFSLGASRATIAAQLFSETALLTFAGAALGLLVAAGASTAIQMLLPDLPLREEIGIDARLLAYTTGAAVVVALLCGVLPVARSTRTATPHPGAGRTHVGGRHTVQWMLVGVQMALSITLLVGAGLLVRSVDALSRVAPGFDENGVLVLRMSANWGETADPADLVSRIDRTLAHLASLPGVEVAATSWSLPGVRQRYQTEFTLVGGRPEFEPPLLAEWRTVSPAYFSVLRISRLAGELCRLPTSGRPTAEVMVNRSFADRYFRGRTVIGSNLSWEGGSNAARIVGVVADARERGMDQEPSPTVYACNSAPSPFPWFLVRTQGDPSALAIFVRSTLKELEPLRSVYDMGPLEERIEGTYAQNRVRMSLLTLFAVTALSLACLGVYGTLSYVISLRRREVALRLALGARRGELVRQILWQAMRVVGIACTCGLLLSVGLRRSLAGMLYGVSPSDPMTLGLAVAVVLTFGFLAAVVPATRATSVEPMRVLREE